MNTQEMADKYAEIQLLYLSAEEALINAAIKAELLNQDALQYAINEIEKNKDVYSSPESRLDKFQKDVEHAQKEGVVVQDEIVRYNNSLIDNNNQSNFPDKELLEHAMSLNKSVYSANNNYPSIPNTGLDSLTSKITEESFLNSIKEIADNFFPSDAELTELLPNEENPLSVALNIWATQQVNDSQWLKSLTISPSTMIKRRDIQAGLYRSPREVIAQFQPETPNHN